MKNKQRNNTKNNSYTNPIIIIIYLIQLAEMITSKVDFKVIIEKNIAHSELNSYSVKINVTVKVLSSRYGNIS